MMTAKEIIEAARKKAWCNSSYDMHTLVRELEEGLLALEAITRLKTLKKCVSVCLQEKHYYEFHGMRDAAAIVVPILVTLDAMINPDDKPGISLGVTKKDEENG